MLDENDIARYVRKALNEYFKDLDGEQPSSSIFDMVMSCVENDKVSPALRPRRSA